jgi:transposase
MIRPDATGTEARIARILVAKGREALPYLRRRGRERFQRELQADGLSLGATRRVSSRRSPRVGA